LGFSKLNKRLSAKLFKSFDKTFSKVFREPAAKRRSRSAEREISLFASRKREAKNWEFLIPNFWLVFSAKKTNV